MKIRANFIIDENGCWVWQKAKDKDGYGIIKINGRNVGAHRHYYKKFKDEFPANFTIHHTCRNRACVNPDHLEAMSIIDNVKKNYENSKLAIAYADWKKRTAEAAGSPCADK